MEIPAPRKAVPTPLAAALRLSQNGICGNTLHHPDYHYYDESMIQMHNHIHIHFAATHLLCCCYTTAAVLLLCEVSLNDEVSNNTNAHASDLPHSYTLPTINHKDIEYKFKAMVKVTL